MTTKTTEKPTAKIGHSKADSVGKKPAPAKSEAPKAEATEAPAATEEKPAEAPAPAEPLPTREVAAGEFTPKAKEPKGKQNQRDFVHAHIGPDRLREIQKLQDTTNYSRTELIQQAWDHFVSREDVAKFLKS